jgi:hypothetical protein
MLQILHLFTSKIVMVCISDSTENYISKRLNITITNINNNWKNSFEFMFSTFYMHIFFDNFKFNLRYENVHGKVTFVSHELPIFVIAKYEATDFCVAKC